MEFIIDIPYSFLLSYKYTVTFNLDLIPRNARTAGGLVAWPLLIPNLEPCQGHLTSILQAIPRSSDHQHEYMYFQSHNNFLHY